MISGIVNDSEFRKALDALDTTRQRAVGARFVKNVRDLSDDERVDFSIKIAEAADANDSEMASAFKSAKNAVLDCYTCCGADADWAMQAGYFVARAANAVVTPETEISNSNPAWQAAMHYRMTPACAVIDTDASAERQENEQQHRILEDFLNE